MAERAFDFFVGAVRDYNSLEEKMQILEGKMNVLTNRANDMRSTVDKAESSHSGKKRKREVEGWLNEVERKEIEVATLKEQAQQATRTSRVQLARRVDTMIEVLEDLREQSKSFGDLLLDVCPSKGMPLVATEWKGQAFVQNLSKIWPWLMNDEISCIGIYGMGGVGKTTLATRIHNNLLDDIKFSSHVYWVTASQEATISKLQNAIARAINLELSGEDDERLIAAKLFNALKRMENFVIIMDDVWKHFDVEKIGIPIGLNGSKLVVTTRRFDVCRSMGCQKEIKVQHLCEDEAWTLFQTKLGHPKELPSDINEVAKAMAKRCAGLPLAIITVAGSMKGKDDIHEWRDALDELEGSSTGPDDEVFQILKYSFNSLRDERLKKCFLYCSLYPEDDKIIRGELIGRFVSEGLIGKRSRQKTFDQGHTILNKLENVCLLEGWKETDGEIKGVKMHDLVREMALKIMTTAKPKCMVKAGIWLKDTPGLNEWTEDLEIVSLMCNQISIIPSGTSPNCPKLSTLILKANDLRSIPDSFFAQLRALKVLDLSHNEDLEELPRSISELENLTALLLRNCKSLRSVPSLQKLKALLELDLFDTAIEEVPEGLGGLNNLKRLNMGATGITSIPDGTLSKLLQLQSLRIPNATEIRIEELEALQHLEEFCGGFSKIDHFNQFVRYHKKYMRPSFYIVQPSLHEDNLNWHDDVELCTCKTVRLCEIDFGEEKSEILLPEDIQELEMTDCHGLGMGICLTDVFLRLNIQKRGLTTCLIDSCPEIKCILDQKSSSSDNRPITGDGKLSSLHPLQSLEQLKLVNLPNLVELCQWESVVADAAIPPCTFSCLRDLHIIVCKSIVKLFTPRLLQYLHNLEVLRICRCSKLEEIIADKEGGYPSFSPSSSDPIPRTAVITLPKLKWLFLVDLPNLRSICEGTLRCDSIERIWITRCNNLNGLPLSLPTVNGRPSPPPTLKVIDCERTWWESLVWDNADAENVLKPFVHF